MYSGFTTIPVLMRVSRTMRHEILEIWKSMCDRKEHCVFVNIENVKDNRASIAYLARYLPTLGVLRFALDNDLSYDEQVTRFASDDFFR